jgi:hypothetical protein
VKEYQRSFLRQLLRGYYRGWFSGGGGGGGGGGGTPTGWPLDYFEATYQQSTSNINAADHCDFLGFFLPASVKFSNISVSIDVSDAAGLYDWGIYSAAGDLLANIGPVHLPSTDLVTGAVLQGEQILNPGRYVFAITGNSTVAFFGYNQQSFCWSNRLNSTPSAGGALPNSAPAFNISLGYSQWAFLLS